MIVTGLDLKVLRRLAGEGLDVISRVPGAADSGIEQEADQAQLRLGVHRQEVARYGINVKDVQEWPDRIRKVTAGEVKAVAARYLVFDHSTTGYLLPQQQAGN